MDQLRELVARIASRPLDRSRPLWECYFVEGLARRTHRAADQEPPDPGRRPRDRRHRPGAARHRRPTGRRSATTTTGARGVRPDPVAAAARRGDRHPREPPHPLDRPPGPTPSRSAAQASRLGRARRRGGQRPRRTRTGRTPRRCTAGSRSSAGSSRCTPSSSDYRAIREVHGGTVNDVILATIAGGLRGWLMTRAESMGGLRTIKAIVPMSVIDDELEPTSLGSQITGHLVHLPIGEPSPVVRLHQVSYDLEAHRDNGRNVSARRLSGIAGFAPTTFHALGLAARRGRAAPRLPRLGHQRAGPAVPALRRRCPDARVLPRPPAAARPPAGHRRDVVRRWRVLRHHADRDAVPDADVLGQCVLEALDELKDSATDTRPRAPRGRKKAGREGEDVTRRYLPIVTAATWPRTGRPTAPRGRPGARRGRRRGERSTPP